MADRAASDGRGRALRAACPSCHGTGFRTQAASDGTLAAVRCPCGDEDRTERLLRAARIPPRYAHCGLDSFEGHDASQQQALELARRWVELWPATEHGLLFLGPPGTGKTHLAVAIARELIRTKGAAVLFCEQRELLKALQGTFDAGSPQREAEVLAPVRGVELLVLDDLGAGRTTLWAQEVMHDIIAYRYNENRKLIMTSNHPSGDEPERSHASGRPAVDTPLSLRDRLGDALMSRLYEMCRIVRISGKDYRRDIRNAEHQI